MTGDFGGSDCESSPGRAVVTTGFVCGGFPRNGGDSGSWDGDISADVVAVMILDDDDDVTLGGCTHMIKSSNSSSSLLMSSFQNVVAPAASVAVMTERFIVGVKHPPAPNWNNENISYDNKTEGDMEGDGMK